MKRPLNPTPPSPAKKTPASAAGRSLRIPLLAGALGAASVACYGQAAPAEEPNQKPNVIIFMCDDIGYGDLGCYGGKNLKTPNIDKMAAEGARFTDFYVTSPVCTPSRAAMLTGRYPVRQGFSDLLWPHDTHGIPKTEILLSDLLKKDGYSTALFGKWHLGHHDPLDLPNARGFEEWFGIPYPNDQDGSHPLGKLMQKTWPPIPLLRNGKKEADKVDVDQITKQLTEETVRYIREHADKPFFVYLAQPMPHSYLGASEKFKGKSNGELYGDAVEELDWSVGEILAALKESGLDKKTLVFFTDDNGATVKPEEKASQLEKETWQLFHGPGVGSGSNAPLRGGKVTCFEGGVRVPFIAWGPGYIKPGATVQEPAIITDFFPTILEYAKSSLPGDRIIDGKSLVPLLAGEGSREKTDFFFGVEDLVACRSGKWKCVLEGKNPRERGASPKAMLFDLENDLEESRNVAAEHPEVVEALRKKIVDFEKSTGWPENRNTPKKTNLNP